MAPAGQGTRPATVTPAVAGPKLPGTAATEVGEGRSRSQSLGTNPVAAAMSTVQLTLFETGPVVRRCYRCGKTKPIATGFHKGKRECRKCRGISSRAWRKKQGPQYRRDKTQWELYRMRWGDYENMLAEQGGACAICRKPLDKMSRQTHTDHKHGCDHPGKGRKSSRGCVRGILCHRCNMLVGWIETEQRLLGDSLVYLGLDGGLIWAYVMRDIGYELISAGEEAYAEVGAGRD